MPVPSAFSTALATSTANVSRYWVEIEGIPYAFGTFSATSSFFASRSTSQQFEGVKPLMLRQNGETLLPAIASQEIDHIEGRCEMGAADILLAATDDYLLSLTPTRRTDGLAYISTAITSSAASITLSGSYTGMPTSSSPFYLPRETVLATRSGATLTVSRRGAYRSQARPFTGGEVSAGYNGELVTDYPRALHSRRVWLYWSLDGDDATDGVLLFSGVVREVEWQAGGTVLALGCDDWQGSLARPIFTDLGSDPKIEEDATITWIERSATGGVGFTTGIDLSGLSDGDVFGLRGLSKNEPTAFLLTRDSTRDLTFNGVPIAGAYGVRLQSMLIAPKDAQFSPASALAYKFNVLANCTATNDTSRFTGGGGNYPAMHPLVVLLHILTSTGEAGANGDFDTLPKSWGLAIPEGDVDTASFFRLIRQTPHFEAQLLIPEPVANAREWIVANLLKPFGFYLRPELGSVVSVGSVYAPTPNEVSAAVAITTDDLAREPDGRIRLPEGPMLRPDLMVSTIVARHSPALVDDKFEPQRTQVFRMAAALSDLEDYPNARRIELDLMSFHDRRTPGGLTGFVVRYPLTAHVEALLTAYADRFLTPPTVIRVTVPITKITIDVGDIVALTLDNLPSPFAASRGISARYVEVLQKSVDLVTNTVTLELGLTLDRILRARFIAPAASITAWNAGTLTLTVNASDFTEGTGNDTDAFTALDAVKIMSADFSTEKHASTIASKTGTTVVLAGAGAYAYAAGDVLILDDYAAATAAQKAASIYAASGSDLLLGGSDSPHTIG